KHAAILGNTGSGKSCTFASIIQSLFDFEFNGKQLKNAHVIIFDTNGEYKQAFQGSKEEPYKGLELVNPFHIDKNGMKVPFWFMNFADFDYLFEPTSGTQAPVFKRALGLAKNQTTAKVKKLIPQAYLSKLQSIIIECDDNGFKIKNTIFSELADFGTEFSKLDTDFSKENILNALRDLLKEKTKLTKPNQYVEGTISTSVLTNSSTT